ncbi:MAG TPA: NADH-quinone oxidoreductase subunit N [Acidobacteriaceae bacterium]|nr:NADH-quinone oxidoreductase subunit N [Acidobacteriaceae bacterium]
MIPARPFDFGQLLYLLAPEILLVLTALCVMAADMFAFRRYTTPRARSTTAALLASFGCIAAIVQIAASPAPSTLLDGLLLTNPLVHTVQISILCVTIAVLLLSAGSRFTSHVGEYTLLILAATCGMLLLAGTQDLLVIFLSLELLSLSLYILAAFDKSARASEAALKYFLFGGMSAGFLLFGFSLLYGLADSTSLSAIATALAASHSLNPLAAVAIVTIAIGLGFKIAAAPLHFWAPDAYQGAPAPSAALIASGSKVASFFLLFQIAALVLAPIAGSAALRHPARGWVPVLAILATASMLVGNLGALRQTSLRRLVAYSAVAHAGYMLVAICAGTAASLSALLYYVVTYALATVGIFAVISALEDSSGSDSLASLAGLSRRSPLLAGSLAIFILSLAGIPPLSGFFGKFYLFVAALESSPGSTPLLWLVVLAIGMSAVSLFYYLQVLKRAYVAPPAPDATAVRAPFLTTSLAVLLAGATILFGCLPHLLLNCFNAAIAASGL